ncbi:divalent-cation tolerance protein CutA [Chromobacterium sp. IIBBL 290-4]|uniref:divalent-cation tolerance protein CutA n=1 Tax=Chromobacterium sp. IIBBL 290-4 TaxID=2953890 RepID=UPI0020B85B60|nr:divalent-cation tolerance protein CutA [Chromobacterium sp. IIBBL 290-4]UTH75473.1 divalent-cation tolerance protein CutA [Chromobacterium sp. IIBBL 290-4]
MNSFPSEQCLLVISNAPDADSAARLAEALVAERLAACVNILAPCRSVYRWQGRVEQAEEVPLLIKTTEGVYPALEARLTALHPYDVPEIVALPLSRGLPAYLRWVSEQTLSSADGG